MSNDSVGNVTNVDLLQCLELIEQYTTKYKI